MKNLIAFIKHIIRKWKIVIFILIATFLSNYSFSQSSHSKTITSPDFASFGKSKNGSYSKSGVYDVGFNNIDSTIYRDALKFNLSSIPTSATITSSNLEFQSGVECGNSNGTIVFTKLNYQWTTWTDYQYAFNLVGSGTNLGSQVINSFGTFNVSLSSLVSDIQAAINSSNPYIAIGAYNQYETANKGTSYTLHSLIINYNLPTPPAPTNLSYNSKTAGSFVFTWDAPSGNVTGYKVYKDGVYYGTTTSTSLLICGLQPDYPYQMTVLAYNSYGDGDLSNMLPFTTEQSAISGPLLICSSENYSVSNVPDGASITWSTQSSNLSVVSGQQNSNPCAFQKVSNGNGTINVAITSSCINYALSFQVHTGPYSSSDYPISGPSSAPCNSYLYYSVPQLSDVTSINWSWPQSFSYVSGQGTRYLALRAGNSGSGIVAVGVNNTCGQSGSYATIYIYIYGFCGYSMVVSPNPVSSELSVQILEPALDETVLNAQGTRINPKQTAEKFTIAISDNSGIIYQVFTEYVNSFKIPVQNLKDGNYILTAYNENSKFSTNFIVKH